MEQLKATAKDAPISLNPKKALGKLDAVVLHSVLRIVADEADAELGKLNKSQMQALLKAYHASDEELLRKWPGILQSGALKPDVQAALSATIMLPDSKLLRYEPSEFS